MTTRRAPVRGRKRRTGGDSKPRLSADPGQDSGRPPRVRTTAGDPRATTPADDRRATTPAGNPEPRLRQGTKSHDYGREPRATTTAGDPEPRLRQDLGEDRVIDTPLAESGIVGTAIGLAVRGYRPVCEIQFDGFVFPGYRPPSQDYGRRSPSQDNARMMRHRWLARPRSALLPRAVRCGLALDRCAGPPRRTLSRTTTTGATVRGRHDGRNARGRHGVGASAQEQAVVALTRRALAALACTATTMETVPVR
jgi:hypothetical protein